VRALRELAKAVSPIQAEAVAGAQPTGGHREIWLQEPHRSLIKQLTRRSTRRPGRPPWSGRSVRLVCQIDHGVPVRRLRRPEGPAPAPHGEQMSRRNSEQRI